VFRFIPKCSTTQIGPAAVKNLFLLRHFATFCDTPVRCPRAGAQRGTPAHRRPRVASLPRVALPDGPCDESIIPDCPSRVQGR
jgi:hypothetical protein